MEEKFKGLSPAEFFLRFKETAGLSNPAKIVYITIRELVENSLDSCEKYRILPVIKLEITEFPDNIIKISCSDNGAGVPDKEIPKSFGQLFYSSKYTMCQHRGLFGMGGKLVMLYGQVETGKPTTIISMPLKDTKTYGYNIKIDVKTNSPIVLKKIESPKSTNNHGLKIITYTKGNLTEGLKLIQKYLEETSIINPYANISLKVNSLIKKKNDVNLFFNNYTNKMPEPPKETKPHPQTITFADFSELVKNSKETTILEFLKNNFQTVGENEAVRFLKYCRLSKNLEIKKLADTELFSLYNSLIKFNFKSASSKSLGLITEEIFKQTIIKKYSPTFIAYSKRSGSYEGFPFAVETVAIYREKPFIINDDEKSVLEVSIHRYANRMPLITDSHDLIYHVINNTNYSKYNLEINKIKFFVHICSTKIPFKSQGKESIADVEEISDKLRLCVLDCTRKLSANVKKTKIIAAKKSKYEFMVKFLTKISDIVSKSLNKPKIPVEEIIKKEVSLNEIAKKST